ncbi:glycosyltransferase [Marinobacter panjinensis]|uniref:Glycosyltransferase n=1 Tax=Marinobacter panjinensis TaxID=2576384 RepID=A0A4U6R2L9_9GAMM|nr:glycosyltransferase [Marinobacter panjinensis]MCR8913719.1 glycosyltransferase [Marinobacter panjinensis]TKV67631.1 glycosyltransferase [Marinobacter panjinensis]
MYDISVILACNRIDQYTSVAVSSVLASIDVNLELILVANGDRCEEVWAYFNSEYGNLANVQILKSPIGQLSFALNFGITFSRSDYIGRMDADDVCMPERFSKQLSYLKEKNLDVLGADIILIDSDGNTIGERRYPKGNSIGFRLFIGAPFCHPSVIFKKRVLIANRGYNSGYNSEDYDLWLRLHRGRVRWENLDEKLLLYRVHNNSTQGSALAYAEVCGYFLREFLISKGMQKLFFLGGGLYSLLKFVLRARK